MIWGSMIPKIWKERDRKAENVARKKGREGERRQKIEG